MATWTPTTNTPHEIQTTYPDDSVKNNYTPWLTTNAPDYKLPECPLNRHQRRRLKALQGHKK